MLGAVAAVGSAASYAFHVRAHFEEVDYALVSVALKEAARWSPAGLPALEVGDRAWVTVVRLYDASGRMVAATPPGEGAPPLDPRAALASPAGPAFGRFPGLAPSIVRIPPSPGAFATLAAPEQRWRAHVLPLPPGDPSPQAYLVTLAPLGDLDSSLATFRNLLVAVGLAGVVAAVVLSYAVAGGALRPISRLMETARAIALSHDLSRRVDVAGRDELGRLAATFNTMLESIEAAYRAQQRFVADASHELRAPLTAILGNLELVGRPDLPEAEKQHALAEAAREARRLSRLVADLLALARADARVPPAMATVDLDAVVLEAFHEARALARDGQAVVLDSLEPVQVRGDADRLKQLLLILLDNAIKYTPPGGRIQVSVHRTGLRAQIRVSDTGVGIPPEDLPYVFERFYRSDAARRLDPGGTGLGLPIARSIAEQHGGEIRIESAPGRGTTVTVELPCLP